MRKKQGEKALEKQLYQSIYGLNKFKDIKQQIVENNLQNVVSEFI